MDKKKRLYRIEEGSKIFGVCGGIAEYFDIDPVINSKPLVKSDKPIEKFVSEK